MNSDRNKQNGDGESEDGRGDNVPNEEKDVNEANAGDNGGRSTEDKTPSVLRQRKPVHTDKDKDQKSPDEWKRKRPSWVGCVRTSLLLMLALVVTVAGWQLLHSVRNHRRTATSTESEEASQTKTSQSKGTTKGVKDDAKTDKALKKAEDLIENDPYKAEKQFRKFLKSDPSSHRAKYGLARSLDQISVKEQSNTKLSEAIKAYEDVYAVPSTCPADLHQQAALRVADRLSFFGKQKAAVRTLESLLQRFPRDKPVLKQLGVAYLMLGMNKEAERVYEKLLKHDPEDGSALVHLGFIAVTHYNQLEKGVDLLKKGIATNNPDADDIRFYTHLGDSLIRLGKREEADKVFLAGVDKGLFPTMYQRSRYNVDRLTARPWWTKEQTKNRRQLDHLEKNWKIIRTEGEALLKGSSSGFEQERERLTSTGDWREFILYVKGQKKAKNCAMVPRTCELLEGFRDAIGCTRGQIKFSVMYPGTHVWPHTGPTNCRLRAHLGLVVPPGVHIRVTDKMRTWTEGKFIIFDDSFEHEVWHNGTSVRLILIVDLWHPEITENEKRQLSPI